VPAAVEVDPRVRANGNASVAATSRQPPRVMADLPRRDHTRLRARAIPLRTRTTPLRARTTPLRARTTPLRGRAIPLRARAIPLRGKAILLRGKAILLRARAIPLRGRIRARAFPVEVRAPRADARAQTRALREAVRPEAADTAGNGGRDRTRTCDLLRVKQGVLGERAAVSDWKIRLA